MLALHTRPCAFVQWQDLAQGWARYENYSRRIPESADAAPEWLIMSPIQSHTLEFTMLQSLNHPVWRGEISRSVYESESSSTDAGFTLRDISRNVLRLRLLESSGTLLDHACLPRYCRKPTLAPRRVLLSTSRTRHEILRSSPPLGCLAFQCYGSGYSKDAP